MNDAVRNLCVALGDGSTVGEIARSPFALSVAPAAAPILVSATLAVSLQHVVLVFSEDTDKGVGKLGTNVPTCSDFISAASAAKLGTNPLCYWQGLPLHLTVD